MSLSIYEVTVPVYLRLLAGLSATLTKAAAYAAEKKVDAAVLLTARLYPNMWPLAHQVNAACNHAVRGPARLAGITPPSFEGKDASFEDLQARIAWTVAQLKSIDEAALNDGGGRTVSFPSGGTEKKMSGKDYLLDFSLPNLYFHLTTAYDILRHNGVSLSKDDFLGA